MHTNARLFVDDQPQTGQTNMDRDARALEEVVAGRSGAVIRIYQWCEPTVSLGYFQKGDDAIDPRLLSCPKVRRLTGGGAILHDNELTYSCCLPDTHPVRSDPIQLYEIVHRAIIALLADCGATAMLRSEAAAAKPSATEPFLCFLRADPRDVVINGTKVLGSAQRRRKGHILQHGSILLQASKLTPELPGIVDLVPDFDLPQFEQRLPHAVADSVSDNWQEANWEFDPPLIEADR